jgi:hypothetical protein
MSLATGRRWAAAPVPWSRGFSRFLPFLTSEQCVYPTDQSTAPHSHGDT